MAPRGVLRQASLRSPASTRARAARCTWKAPAHPQVAGQGDGCDRYTTEIRADEMKMLGSRQAWR